jgi:hypothetical protein
MFMGIILTPFALVYVRCKEEVFKDVVGENEIKERGIHD